MLSLNTFRWMYSPCLLLGWWLASSYRTQLPFYLTIYSRYKVIAVLYFC